MKILYQAWTMNPLYDWALAAGFFLLALLALVLLRRGAGAVVSMLAARAGSPLAAIAVQVLAATRLWLLFPIAVYAGLSVLDLPARLDRVVDLVALVALLIQAAIWINRFISCWLERRIEERRAVDGEAVTALALLGFMGRVVVWVMIFLLILDQLNFDITALVAGLGIGGIAVALAVQNILGDLFASLSIVLDKPFVVGDFIIVGESLGTVEHIGIKTTRVRALGGELIVFSNAELLRSRIRNFKVMYQRRVVFSLGVLYETPLEKLERIPVMMRTAIEAQDRTRFDRAHLTQYGDSAYIFEAVYFVLDPAYGVYADTHQAVLLQIIRDFLREDISFAYPTRTLHVGTLPAAPVERVVTDVKPAGAAP